jgi:hypothetical protein
MEISKKFFAYSDKILQNYLTRICNLTNHTGKKVRNPVKKCINHIKVFFFFSQLMIKLLIKFNTIEGNI